MRKTDIEQVREALRLGHAACANDQRYASLNVIDEALTALDRLEASQVNDEPVAQYQIKPKGEDWPWINVNESAFDSLTDDKGFFGRKLYTQPKPADAVVPESSERFEWLARHMTQMRRYADDSTVIEWIDEKDSVNIVNGVTLLDTINTAMEQQGKV